MDKEVSRRIDGQTPNGGAYAIAYYFDKDKKPCIPQEASFCEIIEYNENDNIIHRTYALV